MKNCKKVHPLLSLYEEGELSARETALVEKHVSGCPVAREELDRLERLRRTLRKFPEPKMPEDLHDQIMARLGRKPERKVFWFNPAWTLAAAAAALAIIVMTQYPRWSGSRNENLAMNKTAPATLAPSPFKDNLVRSDHPVAKQDQKALENKPMVMALKKKAMKKSEVAHSAEVASNEVAKAASGLSAADQATTSGAVASTPPTMVVAMAPMPIRESAEEPKKTMKAAKLRANIDAEVPKEAPREAAPSVQAALPPANAGASASSMPMQALDKASNAQLAYAPQQPQTSWNGSYSPVTIESQALISDATTFQAEWNKVQLGQPLPQVDFTTQAVVLLNAGEKPTTGYSIHISRLEETASQFTIHYQVLTPAPGAITGQMVTHPWVLQAIPKPIKPVVFQKD